MKKLILSMMLVCMLLAACNSNNSKKSTNDVQQMETSKTSKHHLHGMLGVQGNCKMCKDRIEKATLNVKGVSSASWDVEENILHVDFDASLTSLDSISKAIAKAGYDTEKDEADLATYNALPDCCKYRK